MPRRNNSEREYKNLLGQNANLKKSFASNKFSSPGQYAFRGDTGWAQNNYVIFTRKMGPDAPNFYAVNNGQDLVKTLISPSGHQNSSFMKFIAYMKTIQAREENKENQLLSLKVNELKSSGRSQQWIDQITKAIHDRDFSSAFTMINSTDEDLDSLIKERQSKSWIDFQHTNKFWKTQLETQLTNLLMQKFTNDGEKIAMDIIKYPEVSVASIVAEFLDEQLQFIPNNDTTLLRESLESSLLSALNNNGFDLKDAQSLIQANNNNFNEIFKRAAKRGKGYKALTNKGNPVKMATVFNAITRAVERNITGYGLRGKGGEFSGKSDAQQSGDVAMVSGGLLKDIASAFKEGEFIAKGVSIKDDVISFTVFGNDDVKELLRTTINEFESGMNKDFDTLLSKIKDIQAQYPDVEIFTTVQNIKSYKTRHNKFGGLQIEGTGSFYDRANNLKKLSQQLITIGGGDGLSFFDKLIFLLNNTVDGALAAGETDKIGAYIAATILAWMFDDYEELLSVQETTNSLTTIHLFNSGGMYMTASQLINITIDELVRTFSGNTMDRLVNVNIMPPGTFSAWESTYLNLREQIPYDPALNFQASQNVLKERWDIIRDEVMHQGTMGIKINQDILDSYISKIENYLIG